MNIWVDDDFDFLALFSSQLGFYDELVYRFNMSKVSNDNNETETTSERR